MTALNFVLSQEACFLAMDTLALRTDGHALKFTTKFFPLPHLRSVICTTGVHQIGNAWAVCVNERIIATDITVVERNAAQGLQRVVQDLKLREVGSTVTVYHFGYSMIERRVIGFACRSTNNFAPERLQYGFAVKPPDGLNDLIETEVDAVYKERKNVADAFLALMQKQKEMDDQRPLGQRIGIGGEVWFLTLTKDALTMQVMHEFPDHHQLFDQMLDNLPHRGRPNA